MGNRYKRQREKFLHKLLELSDGKWNEKRKINAIKLKKELEQSKYIFPLIERELDGIIVSGSINGISKKSTEEELECVKSIAKNNEKKISDSTKDKAPPSKEENRVIEKDKEESREFRDLNKLVVLDDQKDSEESSEVCTEEWLESVEGETEERNGFANINIENSYPLSYSNINRLGKTKFNHEELKWRVGEISESESDSTEYYQHNRKWRNMDKHNKKYSQEKDNKKLDYLAYLIQKVVDKVAKEELRKKEAELKELKDISNKLEEGLNDGEKKKKSKKDKQPNKEDQDITKKLQKVESDLLKQNKLKESYNALETLDSSDNIALKGLKKKLQEMLQEMLQEKERLERLQKLRNNPEALKEAKERLEKEISYLSQKGRGLEGTEGSKNTGQNKSKKNKDVEKIGEEDKQAEDPDLLEIKAQGKDAPCVAVFEHKHSNQEKHKDKLLIGINGNSNVSYVKKAIQKIFDVVRAKIDNEEIGGNVEALRLLIIEALQELAKDEGEGTVGSQSGSSNKSNVSNKLSNKSNSFKNSSKKSSQKNKQPEKINEEKSEATVEIKDELLKKSIKKLTNYILLNERGKWLHDLIKESEDAERFEVIRGVDIEGGNKEQEEGGREHGEMNIQDYLMLDKEYMIDLYADYLLNKKKPELYIGNNKKACPGCDTSMKETKGDYWFDALYYGGHKDFKGVIGKDKKNVIYDKAKHLNSEEKEKIDQTLKSDEEKNYSQKDKKQAISGSTSTNEKDTNKSKEISSKYSSKMDVIKEENGHKDKFKLELRKKLEEFRKNKSKETAEQDFKEELLKLIKENADNDANESTEKIRDNFIRILTSYTGKKLGADKVKFLSKKYKQEAKRYTEEEKKNMKDEQISYRLVEAMKKVQDEEGNRLFEGFRIIVIKEEQEFKGTKKNTIGITINKDKYIQFYIDLPGVPRKSIKATQEQVILDLQSIFKDLDDKTLMATQDNINPNVFDLNKARQAILDQELAIQLQNEENKNLIEYFLKNAKTNSETELLLKLLDLVHEDGVDQKYEDANSQIAYNPQGDGNCFYSAFLWNQNQIPTKESINNLRTEVAEHIRNNQNIYFEAIMVEVGNYYQDNSRLPAFIAHSEINADQLIAALLQYHGDGNFNNIAQEIKESIVNSYTNSIQNEAWAGAIEIGVVAELRNANINIHSANGNVVPISVNQQNQNTQTIHLYYTGNHYMRLVDNYDNQNNNEINKMNEDNNNGNNIISEEKKNENNNKKLYGGDKSTGVIQYADGMTDEEIEVNLQSIKAAIYSQKKQSEFFIEGKVATQDNIVKNIEQWQINSTQPSKHLSIMTLKNEEGKKHAVALSTEKKDIGLKIDIIDPLNDMVKEFTKEIEDLHKSLSVFNGEVTYTYSNKQDIKSPTCADISLFELFEISQNKEQVSGIANKEKSNKNSAEKEEMPEFLNNISMHELNEKLKNQTEFFLDTGIIFDSLQRELNIDEELLSENNNTIELNIPSVANFSARVWNSRDYLLNEDDLQSNQKTLGDFIILGYELFTNI